MKNDESIAEEIRRKSEDMMKQLKEEEKKAKEDDSLVGRYFRVPVADGAAYYQITDVDETRVKVEHYDHEMNEYRAPYLENGRWIEREWAGKKIKAKEALNQMFSDTDNDELVGVQ